MGRGILVAVAAITAVGLLLMFFSLSSSLLVAVVVVVVMVAVALVIVRLLQPLFSLSLSNNHSHFVSVYSGGVGVPPSLP